MTSYKISEFESNIIIKSEHNFFFSDSGYDESCMMELDSDLSEEFDMIEEQLHHQSITQTISVMDFQEITGENGKSFLYFILSLQFTSS